MNKYKLNLEKHLKDNDVDFCFECEAGEIEEPAIYEVEGKDRDGNDYKGWVCSDHFSMQIEDGAKLKIIEEIEWV